jgi:hypothetical protein
MTFKSVALGFALAATLTIPAQAADLVNGGFETGDLTGWTSTAGFVDVAGGADDFYGPGSPLGRHFDPTMGGASFARLTASGADVYTLLSQTFSLGAASVVSFDAAFLAFDYLDHDDSGYVRLINADTLDVILDFSSSVGVVGDTLSTPWTHFASGVLGAGNYTLEAGALNFGDDDPGYASQILVDSVTVTADTSMGPIPEPASWALMITGFAGLGAVLRRRRALATGLVV